jgi:histidinol-phosphatase
MMTRVLDEELEIANRLADEAAEIALSAFGRGPKVTLKGDRTPVTDVDIRIEEHLREALEARFPSDGVLGEEGGGIEDADRMWVVDPIDGTRNFVAGVQVWATLVALRERGRAVLGVVSAPALGERYEAVRGGGSRLNGRPIRVTETARVADGIVSHAALTDWTDERERSALLVLLAESRLALGFADFWGHCLVARGSIDAVLEPRLRVWDWAAVQVVVEEAGGRITDFRGGPCWDGGPVLTTNGSLHEEIVRRLGTAIA